MAEPAVTIYQSTFTDVRRRLKAIFVGSIGNLIEWYDFYAYAAFALYFAKSFFPGNDPVVQQLNAAIAIALGVSLTMRDTKRHSAIDRDE